MITVIAFIVTIGLLVTIHEYGHFLVARLCGVKVLRFSIGFGKPLFIKKFGKDQTEFVLAAIPLGGFVKMLDERELKAERELEAERNIEAKQESQTTLPSKSPQLILPTYSEAELNRAFNRQSVYKRIIIVLAGPVANLLLAIALYWLLFMQGITGLRPIIGVVEDNSLAAAASLKSGEIIQKINGEPVQSWQDARWILLENALDNKAVKIEALNDDNELHLHTLRFDGIDNDPEIDVLEKVGINMVMPKLPAIIGEILANSAAEKAQLMPKDKILSVDNVDMQTWDAVVTVVQASPNKQLQFKVLRNNNAVILKATPQGVKENGQLIGRLGASVEINKQLTDKLLVELNYSPLESARLAVAKTWDTAIFSLKMLGKMIMGELSIKGISGPVTIATFAGESANMGLKTFLGFLALVSISIGVLNLLPIPVLDGGHLMYYVVEIIKGSPVSESIIIIGQKIGFILLGMMMIIALFNDFNRLLTSI